MRWWRCRWAWRTDGCGSRCATRRPPRGPPPRSEAAGASGWWGFENAWRRWTGRYRRAGRRTAAGWWPPLSRYWPWQDRPGEQCDCLLYTSDAADDLLCVDLG